MTLSVKVLLLAALQRVAESNITERNKVFMYDSVSYEFNPMVDASWQFLLIVCHHYQRLVFSPHERVNDILGKHAVVVVESVKRLVEYEEFRILDEGS